ncbi:MAG: PfkB family carbohydrate kinase [Propionibacteriaceae bacterium]|nr:PfkB family carbohydrate kinase [Propionibacteriaceae bacterium]
MELRSDAQWALVVPSSMGVRLTPEGGRPVHTADRFTVHVTSAETNVASIAAYLGCPALVLTNFVQGSPLAALIKADLRARGLSFTGPELPQGGPWGYRHQFNIADAGAGSRAPRVWNDRAGEVGRDLKAADFDLDEVFGRQGAKILHLSGLIAALSPSTAEFCVELARTAKRHGTAVAVDLNYRASFWQGREEALRAQFTELASLADILVGNEEDFQLSLGLTGPAAGGQGLGGQIESFQAMIGRVREAFPATQVVATTLREALSVNRHLWGMVLWAEDGFHVAEPREIGVVDRIGGGDAAVGGLLYGLLRGWGAEECLRFGWATGALAAASVTDYAAPADEDQVWAVWHGNARVQR